MKLTSLILSALVLSGCGVKGPLYLPENAPITPAPTPVAEVKTTTTSTATDTTNTANEKILRIIPDKN